MMLNMYSIFDQKVEAYAAPFFLATDAVAIRSVGDAMSDPASALGKHPDDYALFRIGVFDDATGLILQEGPEKVVELAALVVKEGK